MIHRSAWLTILLLAAAPGSEAATIQETELAPGLVLLSTDQGSYSNNSLAFSGPDGLLLVDTHATADRSDLAAYVASAGHGDPAYIVNTHRHVEHIGGNDLWGAAPVIIAHSAMPAKLTSGTHLFSEYPPAAVPDITFTDSLSLRFNGETIRMVAVGGSHDDNEIMVHFVDRGIAHVSSTVNGFNFPSVDGDGDALAFARVARRLRSLLPQDVVIVSGHHGAAAGHAATGSWDMLEPYARMMDESADRVRRALAAGWTVERMKARGLLDDFAHYGGSYVDADGWLESLVDALTVPRDTRRDACRPVFDTWKREGAAAAVAAYRSLASERPLEYACREDILLGIGAKLRSRGMPADALEFLEGFVAQYPEAQYGFYGHYLAAQCCRDLGRAADSERHARRCLDLRPGFAPAGRMLSGVQEND